jgi:hypothetical protein
VVSGYGGVARQVRRKSMSGECRMAIRVLAGLQPGAEPEADAATSHGRGALFPDEEQPSRVTMKGVTLPASMKQHRAGSVTDYSDGHGRTQRRQQAQPLGKYSCTSTKAGPVSGGGSVRGRRGGNEPRLWYSRWGRIVRQYRDDENRQYRNPGRLTRASPCATSRRVSG